MDCPNYKVWTNYNEKVLSYDYFDDCYSMSSIPPQGIHSFFLTKNYHLTCEEQETHENYKLYLKKQLKDYAYKLHKDRDEVLKFSSVIKMKFDYFDESYEKYYRSHKTNVITFFKRLCFSYKDQEVKFKHYDPINIKEYAIYKKCNTGGLVYFDQKYKNKTVETIGYDFEMSYPTDLSSKHFKIPTKQGKFCNVDILALETKTIKYGIYHCKIISDDPYFKMVFSFSKNNWYTHYSLMFVLSYMKKPDRMTSEHNRLFDVTIEPIACEKNALIYENEDLVTGTYLFANWFSVVKQMKRKLKGNSIPKFLASSLWGTLCETQKIYCTEEEKLEWQADGYTFSISLDDYNDVDYIIEDVEELNGTIRYTLFDMSKPIYKHNLRLLPFITSFSRYKMQKLITKNDWFDSIIRIQTDSINFIEKPSGTMPENFKLDEKITGKIHYEHLNKYNKIIT